jgi:hypothetical protein
MIEAYLTVHGGVIVIWLFMLQYRIRMLENHITQVHGDLKSTSFDFPGIDLDAITEKLEDSILDTIQNMRPPTAIDHLAGVWSQIMMMREQAKLVKDGILPQSFNEEAEIVD